MYDLTSYVVGHIHIIDKWAAFDLPVLGTRFQIISLFHHSLIKPSTSDMLNNHII